MKPENPKAFPNDGGLGNEGMTLRDYFAAKESIQGAVVSDAMAEALAGEKKPEGCWSQSPLKMLKWEAKWRAALKFMRADAMLEARQQKEAK